MSLEKVSERVKQIGANLEIALANAVDNEGTVAVTAEHFKEQLPEGVTVESIIAGQTACLDFADGLGLALKKIGLDALEKNPNLAAVTVPGLELGLDRLGVQLLRERDTRIPQTGEIVKKHGVLTMSYTSGIGAKRGNFKRIQEATSAAAAGIFGKK